jgi:hypothetical protein
VTENQIALSRFELAVNDLMVAFDIQRPPVPVELMLQRPRPGMWKEINLSELSISFLDIRQRHSPRMSVARLLARNMCRCDWGIARGLDEYANSDADIRALARAIVMPQSMIAELSLSSRAPVMLSNRFEVPEEDARVRLRELGLSPD